MALNCFEAKKFRLKMLRLLIAAPRSLHLHSTFSAAVGDASWIHLHQPNNPTGGHFLSPLSKSSISGVQKTHTRKN